MSSTVRLLGSADDVDYFAFPQIGRADAAGSGLQTAGAVLDSCRPDLVHIHGTEMPQSSSFAAVAAERSIPTVVSIQGLVSVIARHLTAFLPPSVVHGVGARPWVRSERVAGMQRSFEAQGRLEVGTLRSVAHVIGRTSWDRACTQQINPTREYHHCDETLRASFYTSRWDARRAVPHSVFVAQGHYPVKGLHLLLEALPTVLRSFPDTVVTVAGQSPIATGWRTPYSRYVSRLADRLGVRKHIRFVGPQTEAEMLAHYLSSQVLVCPSVIENSPNSVAEAMLLGAPVVAAHVGGVPDMLCHGLEGLTYQADAPYMLAHCITTTFTDPDRASEMGEKARRRALARHDPERNARRTLTIYNHVLAERVHR
jgi:glycosyltransferase involved in cell wall biosynthesis